VLSPSLVSPSRFAILLPLFLAPPAVWVWKISSQSRYRLKLKRPPAAKKYRSFLDTLYAEIPATGSDDFATQFKAKL
jgi:hypothetical protein